MTIETEANENDDIEAIETETNGNDDIEANGTETNENDAPETRLDDVNQANDPETLNDDETETETQPLKRKLFSSPETCGRGVVHDFTRTVMPHWRRQMTNLNQTTFAVSFFLFFALISTAITFGAVYATETNNYFGAVETLLSCAWCGITYALIGGQPMSVMGPTGPVLAFVSVMFNMANTIGVPFLTFNAWVGLWVATFVILAGFFDFNHLIRYATRFTDDIYAMLISAIFIIDAITALIKYFDEDNKSHDWQEDNPDYDYLTAAFLSLILAFGTVLLAFFLQSFKFSSYGCNQKFRTMLFDFAVTISIVTFTIIDTLVFPYVNTQQLNVPDSFGPTFVCCTSACTEYWPNDCPGVEEPWGRRPWLVDLGELNGKSWVPLMAAGPALLAFTLVFLENRIAWHIINHPSHKLSYGVAYNYDTVLMGVMLGVNSIIGIPWITGAPIRSLNHLYALAEKDSSGNIVSVQETRLAALFVHVLMACCLFVLVVIKLIPVPVLYGVFMFMGFVGLSMNQFWHRFLMFFMQPGKYPEYIFVQNMKYKRVHLYTFIQLVSFGVLWAVKSIDAISIIFPLFIFSNIPVRLFVLPKIFSKNELIVLDGDESEIKEFLAHKESTVPMLKPPDASSHLEDVDNDDDSISENP